jgi:UDP-N-acetylmuramate dehydrogenase
VLRLVKIGMKSLLHACVTDSAGLNALAEFRGLQEALLFKMSERTARKSPTCLSVWRALDRQTESVLELSRQDCDFAYRSSIFNTAEKNRYIVLSITYELLEHAAPHVKYSDLLRRFEGKSEAPTLMEVREAVREIRASKGMLIIEGDPDCRSAGSFFKNPILSEAEYARLESSAQEAVPRYPAGTGKVKTSAAWLIDRARIQKRIRARAERVYPRNTH